MTSTEIRQQIAVELATAERKLRECGKNDLTVELLVLSLLRVINSGGVRGVFKVRINGHIVSDPIIDDLKVSLAEVGMRLDEGSSMVEIP